MTFTVVLDVQYSPVETWRCKWKCTDTHTHTLVFSIAPALLEPSIQAAKMLHTWVIRKANEPVLLGLG